jgi:hypothetical protein
MEVFHILEFMGQPYEIDLETLNEAYGMEMEGSHLILFQASRDKGPEGRPLQQGLYERDPFTEGIRFLGPAMDFSEIKNRRQFLILETVCRGAGNPRPVRDPLERVCRILLPFAVLGEEDHFVPKAQSIVNYVYERMFP